MGSSSHLLSNHPMESSSRYFPYEEVRKGQQQILNAVRSTQPVVVVEAETGAGKSIASLSACLDWMQAHPGTRLIIFVKTHNQLNSFLREWSRIIKSIDLESIDRGSSQLNKPTILPLLGKRHVCRIPHPIGKHTIIPCPATSDRQISNKKLYRKLPRLIKSNRQGNILKFLNKNFVEAPTVAAFQAMMARYQNCPYFTMLSLLPDADIVLTTYGNLEPSRINRVFQLCQTKAKNTIFLLDEVHNLIFEQSVEVSIEAVEFLVAMIRRSSGMLQAGSKVSESFLSWLETTHKSSPIQVISRKQYKSFKRDASAALQVVEWAELLFGEKHNRRADHEAFKALRAFLQKLKRPDHAILISTPLKYSFVTLDPSRLFKYIRRSPKLVLQTATFNPPQLFQRAFNLRHQPMVISSIETSIPTILKDPKQQRLVYTGGLNSNWVDRGPRMYSLYADRILQVLEHSPKHLLVLTPSYEFAKEIARYLQKPRTTSEDTDELNFVMETAEASISLINHEVFSWSKPGIILGNQRGKLYEGNEWVDTNGRSLVGTVIFAGLFTDTPHEERLLLDKLRMQQYKQSRMVELVRRDVPLFIRIKQAMGRARRHADDKVSLLVLDNRAVGELGRVLVLRMVHSYERLLERYREFWR